MPAHSRSKNGIAEPVTGPRVRADPLARLCRGHPRFYQRAGSKDVDGRVKPGHDGVG
jgi:hypothetical protein